MIGAYIHFGPNALAPHIVQRFAASLGVGLKEPAKTFSSQGTLAAAVARSRTWSPARTQRGQIVLLAGKIDNHADIGSVLGRRFTDDASLYAAAYDAWGDHADLRLIGNFSTILITPHEHCISLSRSPFQAPPLHFYRDKSRIIVASTPRAIFATGEVSEQIDEQKIADSLFLNYCEGDRGWFKDVHRVGVGNRVLITPDRVVSLRYYDPNSCPSISFAKDSAYVEAADALLTEATRNALDGFSKPAVSLSGGLDSQAVAAYAIAARPGLQVHGFTGVPEEGWSGSVPKTLFADERPYVEALAEMYPELITEWVDARGYSFDHHLKGMFLLGCIAPRNPINLIWLHEVHARAKSRGCDVLLTGALGNVSFSFGGEGMIADLFRHGHWIRALREVWLRKPSTSVSRAFWTDAIRPNIPRRVVQLMKPGAVNANSEAFASWCPLNPEWAAEMRVVERALDMNYDHLYLPATSTRAWRSAFLDNAMNEAGDVQQAMELLHGIPTRDPTAYRPLLEFCLGIPDEQFLKNGESRRLARRMLRDRIPAMVLNEKRRGLQSADWHIRLSRERSDLIREIDGLSDDPRMARRLNLPGLRKALVDMTDQPPKDPGQRKRLRLAVARGLTTARFIRHVEGRNEH